jgi:hypothetical protein
MLQAEPDRRVVDVLESEEASAPMRLLKGTHDCAVRAANGPMLEPLAKIEYPMGWQLITLTVNERDAAHIVAGLIDRFGRDVLRLARFPIAGEDWR